MQVEAVTLRDELGASSSNADESDEEPFELGEGRMSRVEFENMVLQLNGMLDEAGLTEGPRWPVVSVTPLAIYRGVAPAP